MHLVIGPAPARQPEDGHPAPSSAASPTAPDAAPQLPHSLQAIPVTDGHPGRPRTFALHDLPRFVQAVRTHTERPDTIRWVFADTSALYPVLLAAEIELERVHDLTLCQRILATAATDPGLELDYAPVVVLPSPQAQTPPAPLGHLPPARQAPGQEGLFDVASQPAAEPAPDHTAEQLAAELDAQLTALAEHPRGRALTLLLAAESQAAVIAEEIHHHGLPWNRQIHEQQLEENLGPRPAEGRRPAKMQELAEHLRELLGAPQLNPDSPQDLLKALNAYGATVTSTRKWDLVAWADQGGSLTTTRRELIAPILYYKQLHRLWTANGWHWLDEWVHHGRFHPRYVIGGVVTGRWAAHGGGALQIPKSVRGAVRADQGWVLTVADASQVEPRILAAMSHDRALAVAGQGQDMYLGIARIGQRMGSGLNERQEAKVALLGAMYGATTGQAGALVPQLRELFPQALALVEQAASTGERGGQVHTWLGRTSPLPDERWFETVRDVSTAQAEARSRQLARAQGRFTRNFVVQGTAAEWAMCWMGEVRRRLRTSGANGTPLSTRLVFFVHDEVVLHGPAEEAEAVRRIVEEAASAAGRLLFGAAPVEFPLSVAQVDSYAEAK